MNDTIPAISIIVLSYDRPEYLRVALDSVAVQTSRDFEVVIADDASPDPAVDQALRECAGRIERFAYERPERNVGVVANLLRAIGRTSGRYVTILCDDDALEPAFVARMVEALDADATATVAFCNVAVIDSQGLEDALKTAAFQKVWGREYMTTGPVARLLHAALATRTLQPAMGAVFRKDAIAWSDFPKEAAGAWDLWLGYLAAREGSGGTFVSDRLFRYRVHANALTARRDVGWHRGQVALYERFLVDDRLAHLRPIFRDRFARYSNELGMALLRRGENAEARTAFTHGRRFGVTINASVGTLLSYLPSRASGALFGFYARIRGQRPLEKRGVHSQNRPPSRSF